MRLSAARSFWLSTRASACALRVLAICAAHKRDPHSRLLTRAYLILQELVLLRKVLCSYLMRSLLAELIVHCAILAPQLVVRTLQSSAHHALARKAVFERAVSMPRTRELGKSPVKL